MEIEFRNASLDRLEIDAGFSMGLPLGIVRQYRRRVQSIRSAVDERDLRAVKGNRLERLKGDRSHQLSLRLNDQWRLIVEIRESNPKNTIVVVGVEDYH
jgi:proteic killer suppression protein